MLIQHISANTLASALRLSLSTSKFSYKTAAATEAGAIGRTALPCSRT